MGSVSGTSTTGRAGDGGSSSSRRTGSWTSGAVRSRSIRAPSPIPIAARRRVGMRRLRRRPPHRPPRRRRCPATSPTVAPDPVDGHIAGILVGDFSSVDAAEGAVATIQQAFGGAAMLEVVDSLTAPNIVRPGVWAVVMLLPERRRRARRAGGLPFAPAASIKIGAGWSPHEHDPSDDRRRAGVPGARAVRLLARPGASLAGLRCSVGLGGNRDARRGGGRHGVAGGLPDRVGRRRSSMPTRRR